MIRIVDNICMKLISKFLFLFLFYLTLSACGTGGNKSDHPSQVKVLNVSGNWFLKGDVNLSECESLEGYNDNFSITFQQSNNVITVVTPFGTFKGLINKNKLSWSGQYLDKRTGKYFNFSKVNLSVINQSVSGVASVEIRDSVDGEVECLGSVNFSGNTLLASGEVPVAPVLRAAKDSEITDTSAKLRWIDRSINEDGFIIERSLSENDGYEMLAEVAANAEEYDDMSLIADTSYYYRVTATNNSGISSFSNIIMVTSKLAATVTPLAPSSLSGSNIQSSSLQLSWIDNADSENGFKIERSLEQNANYTEIASLGINVTSFIDSNLQADTNYFYRAFAFNSAGNSQYSNVLSVTTADIPPQAPSNLTQASKTDVSIQISWNDNADNETQMIVERSLSQDSGFEVIATLGANAVGYADTGLTAETSYFYRVKSSNSAGDSSYSNILSVTTNAPPVVPPDIPDGFAVSASKTSLLINLSWNDVDNESNYEVERSINSSGPFEKISELGADSQSYTDNDIVKGTLYFYRIRAKNTAGVSAYTDALSDTSAHDADPVSSLTAVAAADGSSVTLNWLVPDNIQSLDVQRSEQSDTGFESLSVLTASDTQYIDTAIVTDIEYFYKIIAINELANTASVTISVTIPGLPGNPVGLQINPAADAKTVSIKWGAADNADSYRVERSLTSDPWAAVVSQDVGMDLSFVDDSVAEGVTYFYRVYAVNAVGENFSAISTTVPERPNAPIKVAISLAPSSTKFYTDIKLRWVDNADNEDGFTIRIGYTPDPSQTRIIYSEIAKVSANSTSYTHKVLTADLPTSGSMCVIVSAFNKVGLASAKSVCHDFGSIIRPLLSP